MHVDSVQFSLAGWSPSCCVGSQGARHSAGRGPAHLPAGSTYGNIWLAGAGRRPARPPLQQHRRRPFIKHLRLLLALDLHLDRVGQLHSWTDRRATADCGSRAAVRRRLGHCDDARRWRLVARHQTVVESSAPSPSYVDDRRRNLHDGVAHVAGRTRAAPADRGASWSSLALDAFEVGRNLRLTRPCELQATSSMLCSRSSRPRMPASFCRCSSKRIMRRCTSHVAHEQGRRRTVM